MYKLGYDKVAIPASLRRILTGAGIGVPVGAATGAIAKRIQDPDAELSDYLTPSLAGAGIGAGIGALSGLGLHAWKERTPKDFIPGIGKAQALDNLSPDRIVKNNIPIPPSDVKTREDLYKNMSDLGRLGEITQLHPDVEVSRKGDALLVKTVGRDRDNLGRRAGAVGTFSLKDKDLLERVKENIKAVERDVPEEVLQEHLVPYLKKVQRHWLFR